MREFENPWRKAHEARAAVTWAVSAAMMFGVAVFTKLPAIPFFTMFCIAALMTLRRGVQATKLWAFHASLMGRPLEFITPFELCDKMKANKNGLWLGYGFTWTPTHTQRAIEVRKRDIRTFLPPEWYMQWKGMRKPGNAMGAAWLHGIGQAEEKDLYVPLESIQKGNKLVLGTNRAFKTRYIELIIAQAIIRNEVVIVIDPKGDRQLRESMKRICELMGKAERFAMFHPAFPDKSVRLDVLKNFNRATEIASRIIAALPSAGDSFGNFCWEVANSIDEGLIGVDRKPSLQLVAKYVSNPDLLMEEVLVRFFRDKVAGWESLTGPFIREMENAKGKGRGGPQGSAKLYGYITFYQQKVADELKDQRVDKLIQQVTHNREHYGKMIISLTPLLTMLTAGELGPLLSPDYEDVNDARPIFDTERIIKGRHVMYIGLDSLSDSVVSGAIGSMVLADFASVAGARYNFGGGDDTIIQLLVDEAAEVANEPLTQILNKGGGANIHTTLVCQTVSDFISRLGSEDAALKVFGNCNALVAGRTLDTKTQKLISDRFGKTHIQQTSRSLSNNSRTEDHGLEFGGSSGESISDQEVSVFPPELLGMMPNLQFVAFVQGGSVIKSRIPILELGKK